jgi:two-component system cell cycle sensor histidine kinase/response regulator CckA
MGKPPSLPGDSQSLTNAEALEKFRNAPDQFDLIITDQTMPKMTGKMLSREILKIRDDIAVILSTGYSNIVTEEKINKFGIKEYIM